LKKKKEEYGQNKGAAAAAKIKHQNHNAKST